MSAPSILGRRWLRPSGVAKPMETACCGRQKFALRVTGDACRSYCRTTRFESPVSPRLPRLDSRLVNATVQIRGDRYGSREYMLLPSNLTVHVQDAGDDQEMLNVIRRAQVASLRANRNMLFGARCFVPDLELVEACRPLVSAAVADAGMFGEQPQALAALHGLCSWVAECLERGGEGSIELAKIMEKMAKEEAEGGGEATIMFEAVKAIATGTPRPGHKVLGAGTYRDGRNLWEELAREFAAGGADSMAREAELFRSCGGEVVGVEHLADTSEPYLRAAGGTMVRFFFVLHGY